MTENFPGGPADDSGPVDETPQASASGPAEPAEPATDGDQPVPPTEHSVQQPDPGTPSGSEWARPWSGEPAQPASQPLPVPASMPVDPSARPTYPPLGQQGPVDPGGQSGGIPVAQMPQSPWATGYGGPAYQQNLPPQQPGYGGYQPPTGPITTGYPMSGLPPEPPRRRNGGLIVLIAVLALVIGGAAGGLGGYLVSSNNNDVVSSLDQPLPASQTANAPAGSVQAVANKLLPVVVTIAAEFQQQGSLSGDTGSGVVISSDGDILTNNHVIADAASGGRIQVIFANGKSVDATIVGRDPTTDIAVIKAQGVSGLPIARLGSSGNLSVGQNVVAIGAPFALSGTVTSGIVSSLHRPTAAGDGSSSVQDTVLDAIQTDAPINPGNSGGPLVNMQGEVIGINSAIYSPNSGGVQGQSQGGNVGIGFAIPMDQAKRIATEITKTGKAIQTVMGVSVTDNTPSQGGQPSILPNGALIRSVTSGGPADKAGLKAGSIVVKADGRLVTSSDGLVAAVHAAAPGDRMQVTLSTGKTVTITLAGQPVNPN
jgi:putative serine protease PepD